MQLKQGRGIVLSDATWAAYLMFMFIGIVFNLAGVATLAIARKFAVDAYTIGYIFALYPVGQSLAVFFNGYLLERIELKRELLPTVGLVLAATAGMTVGRTLPVFAVSVFIYGLGTGLLLSIGNFILVSAEDQRARTAKLNIANFFFSFGAILSPIIAGVLLARQVCWEQLYQLAVLLFVIVCGVVSFDFTTGKQKQQGAALAESWHMNVYLIGISMFFYTLSEVNFSFWIVTYLNTYLSFDLAVASFSLSLFWGCIALGRFLSGLLAHHVDAEYYIVAASLLACAASFSLLFAKHTAAVFVLIAIMGLGYSGLYASILAYGTMQLPHPSPKLMAFYVTVGSAGVAASFLVSSFLKQVFDVRTSLFLSACLMLMITLLIGVTIWRKTRRDGKVITES